ncbi:hypothetical protein DFH08DRAFT_825857 [Mycena albidolilacea]|uniref:Uncharacterized protein n=1 Tax=Mycena albidolilacea TaxID=1033008 RepID=A0AAD6Z2D9_9AGAR|nr:hypothetical protein DFH08DRAFT_825857 [Mycena albidolilacea]
MPKSTSASSKSEQNAKRATTSARRSAENRIHCVRCHAEYRPSRNGPRACKIKHYKEDMAIEQCQGGYMQKLLCCGLGVWNQYDEDPPSSWKPAMCFVGRHTTVHEYSDGARIVHMAAESCAECDKFDGEYESEYHFADRPQDWGEADW